MKHRLTIVGMICLSVVSIGMNAHAKSTPTLSAQEKLIVGTWFCQSDYKTPEFNFNLYGWIEYFADKTYTTHQVGRESYPSYGGITGVVRYSDTGTWSADRDRYTYMATEVTKLDYSPILSIIPYWLESTESTGESYTMRIETLDNDAFISVDDETAPPHRVVCQRI
ncbi:hypothetical protein U0021_02975 [Moraxella canis]|uniref:Uncharacterized protein n=1 Tax=Moraxella canis TaxID=90239 RepID=A0ABZ0WZ92_9GAMM|nr:hypothetical protein [Moraxella canis]WQE04569.1 hypothetical protein U0021_02975 [Moraxella canis]